MADHLSFTLARSTERSLAVSSQIKRYEIDLGVELFARSTTSVAVSPGGAALATYARRILALGDEAVQRLRQHDVCAALGRLRCLGPSISTPVTIPRASQGLERIPSQWGHRWPMTRLGPWAQPSQNGRGRLHW